MVVAVVIAIIQARLGSERFPRKMLADLCGRPVIRHVVDRALQIHGVDRVIVATPSWADMLAIGAVLPEDERLSVFCAAVEENDVLGRFVAALESYPECDTVMRLTGDTPLLQPNVCERVLALEDGTEYCWTDTHSGEWPDGLDCEVFPRRLLTAAHEQATDPSHREHVTSWMREHAAVFALPPDPDYAGWLKCSIDTEEDLEVVRQFMQRQANKKGTATIAHVVRWAENTKELQRNLAEGLKQIDALGNSDS